MNAQKVFRIVCGVGVVSVSVYVLVSGIIEGRAAEAIVYVALLSPMVLMLTCLLSEALMLPKAIWGILFRRDTGQAELEEQSQEV